MTFGQRIRRLRKGRGWTQVEFAEKMQVNDRYVSRWETDKNLPTRRTLERMAALFELTVEELFGGDKPQPEPVLAHPVLLKQFKEIQELTAKEQEAISIVLDAFLTKKRMEKVLQAQVS